MSKEFSAETFEMYSLQGTPSSILVDRKGILRDISFGQNGLLESKIQTLLNEQDIEFFLDNTIIETTATASTIMAIVPNSGITQLP